MWLQDWHHKIEITTNPDINLPLLSKESIKELIKYCNDNDGLLPNTVKIEYEIEEEPTFDGNSEKYDVEVLKLNDDRSININIGKKEKLYTKDEVGDLVYSAMKSIGHTPTYVWQEWVKENLKK